MTEITNLTEMKAMLKVPLGNQIGRVHRLWRSAITASVQSLGMTEARWTAMLHLKMLGEGATQQALAQELGIEMPSLSRTLSQLVEQDMLQRQPHPTDKRAQCLYFTATGQQMLAKLIERTMQIRQALYQDLTPAAVQQLMQSLDIMERNARTLLLATATENKA
ncbi:MarR family transcriptional regulator, transcriptional regulator for hemolysin [Rheinheimera pacifica]|uniref:MarR family transcriptional regulator, transcriptional regulator for hemolysin n=1 Tax=Rheinheimera pacifica TaxID=173990 RepID=A0A1H6J3C8_9GAMM|nr:MarR family transcriptional regulator [Rheinheimera pacifica]SEH56586.1 MarR family transcriptional regulator, transcriptional regulator for hemolysin [Rheinheimera pacifica]